MDKKKFKKTQYLVIFYFSLKGKKPLSNLILLKMECKQKLSK